MWKQLSCEKEGGGTSSPTQRQSSSTSACFGATCFFVCLILTIFYFRWRGKRGRDSCSTLIVVVFCSPLRLFIYVRVCACTSFCVCFCSYASGCTHSSPLTSLRSTYKCTSERKKRHHARRVAAVAALQSLTRHPFAYPPRRRASVAHSQVSTAARCGPRRRWWQACTTGRRHGSASASFAFHHRQSAK